MMTQVAIHQHGSLVVEGKQPMSSNCPTDAG